MLQPGPEPADTVKARSRVVTTIGGLEWTVIEAVAAKEAEQTPMALCRLGCSFQQCLTAVDPWLGVNDVIFAPIPDVDCRPIGVSDEQAPQHSVTTLESQRHRRCNDTKARPNYYV
jgi:hypothetical protein